MADPIRQLLSQTSYVADGINTVWNFSFAGGYLDRSHVKAFYKDGNGNRAVVDVSWVGPYQLSIVPPVPAGAILTIHRQTPCDLPLVDFADKAQLTEVALDTSAKQAVFLAAEATDTANYTLSSTDEIFSMVQEAKLSEVGAAASAAEAKGYMDSLLIAMTFPFDFGQIADPVINNQFDLGGL